MQCRCQRRKWKGNYEIFRIEVNTFQKFGDAAAQGGHRYYYISILEKRKSLKLVTLVCILRNHKKSKLSPKWVDEGK